MDIQLHQGIEGLVAGLIPKRMSKSRSWSRIRIRYSHSPSLIARKNKKSKKKKSQKRWQQTSHVMQREGIKGRGLDKDSPLWQVNVDLDEDLNRGRGQRLMPT